MASNAENVSIWWRHHIIVPFAVHTSLVCYISINIRPSDVGLMFFYKSISSCYPQEIQNENNRGAYKDFNSKCGNIKEYKNMWRRETVKKSNEKHQWRALCKCPNYFFTSYFICQSSKRGRRIACAQLTFYGTELSSMENLNNISDHESGTGRVMYCNEAWWAKHVHSSYS